MIFREEDAVEIASRRTVADWIWGGVGFTTAAASAGFAAYMAIIGPVSFGHPANSLGRFASLARLTPLDHKVVQTLHGPPRASQAGNPDAPPVGVADAPVDFAPTGTVTDPDARKIEPNRNARPSSGAASLPGYVLRDVFDGKALVESRSSLALVAPGSRLDGAGQVESIERRGDAWVVKTTSGIITTGVH